MADKKSNPLIGAFRDPEPAAPPPVAATTPPKATDAKTAADAAAKPGDVKKPDEPPKATDAKPADTAAKPGDLKKPDEAPKATNAKAAEAAAKPGDAKKPDEPPKTTDAKAAAPKENDPSIRFVPISKIKPLPGSYVKDQPKADYSDMIKSIKEKGLEKPVILRQGEDGNYQLVHGFHRLEAVKQAGMLEIKADVYDMKLKDAVDYRKNRDAEPDAPIPGKLIKPGEEKKAEAPAAPAAAEQKEQEAEIPKDFKLPIAKEGVPEMITTMKVEDIHPFEGHPFNVKDDKDM